MLSRVADSLYWLSRYIERAENLTRLIEVNLQLILDFSNLDDQKVKDHWQPILRALCDEDAFAKVYDKADSQTVTDFITFRRENPNSILSCLFAARENARMIRDQITAEMWESINELYLFLRSTTAKKVWRSGVHEFFREVKKYIHAFQGLTHATYPRDDAYNFLQIGRYLERADKTTRIIDLKYHILLPRQADIGGALDTAQWMAILRSCSALQAFHRLYVESPTPVKVVEFLILNETFPRSLRFCLKELNSCLHRVSETPLDQFTNNAERVCGRMLSHLSYCATDDIFKEGLHEYLDRTQLSLNEIGAALYHTYMYLPPPDASTQAQVA
jgi:uncharacterized alpha-E superfamily protein